MNVLIDKVNHEIFRRWEFLLDVVLITTFISKNMELWLTALETRHARQYGNARCLGALREEAFLRAILRSLPLKQSEAKVSPRQSDSTIFVFLPQRNLPIRNFCSISGHSGP